MSTTLPSSSLDVVLEARIREPEGAWVQPRGLAILAHRGSMSDHVISSVSRLLSELGFRTVRFNSRGVGASQGKGSWTGETEAADYLAVTKTSIADFSQAYPAAKDCQLLIGYSAGAMYASAVLQPTLSPMFDSARLCLFVSYPLDKLWALSAFGTRKWTRRMEQIAQSKDHRTLLIQGTEDQFTNHTNYEKWCGRLATVSETNHLHMVTVEGADHFWRTREHLGGLIEAIRTWADTVK
ncbi:alpha/beta-hydrolase [Microstroma glucosiphilum]|uniref:Alpha/beta-hydrolase n=1 Tax=Pseudomicrostroma glucosiphilum TaxID=1684307 RepID=A0A316U4B7_9BASI|nr:alpha/beta-hydrolase [Pseudomicrostroma glucosiphilum]PWN19321.1 alpha/beta-hydrolase [Pseudomicrostroma glucosiphilum]